MEVGGGLRGGGRSRQGGGGEGGGRRQVKAGRRGLQGPGSQINLHNCGFNV